LLAQVREVFLLRFEAAASLGARHLDELRINERGDRAGERRDLEGRDLLVAFIAVVDQAQQEREDHRGA